MIVSVCFKSFEAILDFSVFVAPPGVTQKYRENLQNFGDFPQIFGNFGKFLVEIFEKFWRVVGGYTKSKKYKIGQNVFKQPKTIIESRPSTTSCRTTSVRPGPTPPFGGPR